MADEAPPRLQSWDQGARHETYEQRLDRNFGDMLQELRVAQTGVQILFAFLLTAVFSSRSSELHGATLVLYSVTMLATGLATCLLIAPVACHRVLFRHGVKDRLVAYTQRLTVAGLALLAVSIIGSLLLVLELTLGWLSAGVLVGLTSTVFITTWLIIPLAMRRTSHNSRQDVPAAEPKSLPSNVREVHE